MKCPTCNTELKEVTRQEITVDECPTCKGLWLNRDVLSKIITRSEEDLQTATQLRQPGSVSLKHARRDEDWIDYYPEGSVDVPKSSLAEILRV